MLKLILGSLLFLIRFRSINNNEFTVYLGPIFFFILYFSTIM